MNVKELVNMLVLVLGICSISTKSSAQAYANLELGVVVTGYNDVRIPGNEGSLFSLKDDLKASPEFFYRLKLDYQIKGRHTISLLYAPLKTSYEGVFTYPVDFAGTTFPQNIATTGIYKFNSYRFTYRYKIVSKPKFELDIGLTGKIRDAEIELSNADLKVEKSNLGFVPLIAFMAQWKFHNYFSLLLEGDALIAAQGRAEDIIIAVAYKTTDDLTLKMGYRILEGGADGGSVYNFTLFHYLSFGMQYKF